MFRDPCTVSRDLHYSLRTTDNGRRTDGLRPMASNYSEKWMATIQQVTNLITKNLSHAMELQEAELKLRQMLQEEGVSAILEYVTDGRNKIRDDTDFTRHYSIIDPESSRCVIIAIRPNKDVEYRHRGPIIFLPHEIPIPEEKGIDDIMHRVQAWVVRINDSVGVEIIDTAWIFGSWADGDWTRDVDDVDVFLRVAKQEYLNVDIRRETEFMMHQVLFTEGAGYIKSFDVYLYFNPERNSGFLHDPQTIYYDEGVAERLNIRLIFNIPLISYTKLQEYRRDDFHNAILSAA